MTGTKGKRGFVATDPQNPRSEAMIGFRPTSAKRARIEDARAHLCITNAEFLTRATDHYLRVIEEDLKRL